LEVQSHPLILELGVYVSVIIGHLQCNSIALAGVGEYQAFISAIKLKLKSRRENAKY
jgi:hypothetical protein